MDEGEPSYTTDYECDAGGRRQRCTLRTCWSDLDPTPWRDVADKARTALAVRRFHEALVAINQLPSLAREAALAGIGDLTGLDLETVAARVEAAAARARQFSVLWPAIG